MAPGKCTICTHRERAAIDLALAGGLSMGAIGKRYGLSRDALYRHRQNHLPPTLRAKLLAGPNLDLDLDQLREQESQSLLAHLVALRHRIFAHLDTAEEVGDNFAAARAVSQLHTNLETTAKLLGELGVGHQNVTVTNLLISPDYIALRLALVEALRAHPEAAANVARVLHNIERKAVAQLSEAPQYAKGPVIQPQPPLIDAKPIREEPPHDNGA